MKHRSVLSAVLVGGSIAGALDILFAISFAGYNGVPRLTCSKRWPAGLLGNELSGGILIAALGLVRTGSRRTCWQESL